jgi:hypothetical protein
LLIKQKPKFRTGGVKKETQPLQYFSNPKISKSQNITNNQHLRTTTSSSSVTNTKTKPTNKQQNQIRTNKPQINNITSQPTQPYTHTRIEEEEERKKEQKQEVQNQ